MGHPDNIQLYLRVSNVRFVDNLMLAGGQNLFMQQSWDGELAGNMALASGGNSVGGFGIDRNTGEDVAWGYLIHNNTVAFARYNPIGVQTRDNTMRDNIFMSGNNSSACGFDPPLNNYIGDNNLFFNFAGGQLAMLMSEGNYRTLEEIRALFHQDAHSLCADPLFRNAPAFYMNTDPLKVHLCTTDTLYLASGSQGFSVGDYVETNFDGVHRSVTAVTTDTITIAPALDQKPFRQCMVVNWGASTDFNLDLRLKPESPGAHLASDGNAVGSNVDVTAYRAGDFDGDGVRDLPDILFE
jgi:hypothetical protein